MDVRPSPIAGQWYAGRPDQLAATVDGYLAVENAEAPLSPPRALIAPHAGHRYSGAVAGQAFRLVRGLTFDVVAILCPSHFHDQAALLTSGHTAYQTPLGEVPVAHHLIAELQHTLPLLPIRRDREHAIEIELPFLQRALVAPFTLLPIMMRDQTAAVAKPLGEALARILVNQRALIVGSSDLSHFYSQAEALKLDAEMLKPVAALDPDGVLQTQASGRGFACGAGAMAATLWAARALGANRAQILHHSTSAATSGDNTSVVGYAAAAIWQEAD